MVWMAVGMAAASVAKDLFAHGAASEAWEQQVKAANINTARQQTALKINQRQQLEQLQGQRQQLKIASLSEQGRQREAAATTGVTGKYIDRAIQETVNKADRAEATIQNNVDALNSQVDLQVRQMWSQYTQQAKATKPEMDWGAALVNAGTAALSAYAAGAAGGGAASGGTASAAATSSASSISTNLGAMVNEATSYLPTATHMSPSTVNRLLLTM